MSLGIGSLSANLTAKTDEFISKFKVAGKTIDDFGSRAKSLTDQLKNLERQKEATQQKLDSLNTSSKNYATTSQNLANRLANLDDRYDTQKQKLTEYANKQVEAENKTERFGNKLNDLGNIAQIAIGNYLANAMVLATEKIADFATAGFNLAKSTERQSKSFTILTGSSEKQVQLFKDIQEIGLNSSYSVDTLRGITKKFLALGTPLEKIPKTIRMLGDISAGTGGNIELMALALTQMQAKGKVAAQEINQFAEQGVPVRDILAKNLGVTTGEIIKMGEEGKISFEMFNTALQQVHKDKFMGLLAEDAKSLDGRWQNLNERIAILFSQLIGVDTITGKIIEGSAFDRITNSIAITIDYLDKYSGAITNAFNVTTNWFASIDPNILISLATGIGAVATILLIKAIPAMIAWTVSVWSAVVAQLALIAPFVAVGLAVAGLTYAILWLYKNWDWVWAEITKIANDSWNAVAKFFSDGWNSITEVFTDGWNWLSQTTSNGINSVIAFFQPAVNFITSMWSKMVNFLNMSWQDKLKVISYFAGYIAGNIYKTFLWLQELNNQIWTTITNWAITQLLNLVFFALSIPNQINQVWEVIKQFATNKFNELVDRSLARLNELVKFVLSMPNQINQAWENIKSFGQQKWNEFVDFVQTKANQLGNEISKKFEEIKNNAVDVFNKLKEINLKKTGEDIINGLMDGIKSKWNDVRKLATDIGKSFERGFKDAMGIRSPSRVMMLAGKNIVQGLEIGIDQEQFNLARTVTGMAGNVVNNATYNQQRNYTQNIYQYNNNSITPAWALNF